MLVLDSRFLRMRALEVWWPDGPESVYRLLSRVPVVTVMQCGTETADALAPVAFRRKPFHTTVIDITRSEAELWSQFDQKSCRTDINRAKRLGCDVTVNEHPNEARRLISDFIARRGFRAGFSDEEWQRYLTQSDVFVGWHRGQAVATHVVRVDGTCRARVLAGATVPRGGEFSGSAIAAFNRYLIWHQTNYYRAAGVRAFDLGGVTLDQGSPMYSITRFKLAFGGDVIEEQIMRLAANAGLRVSLKGASKARRMVDAGRRRIDAWRQRRAATDGRAQDAAVSEQASA